MLLYIHAIAVMRGVFWVCSLHVLFYSWFVCSVWHNNYMYPTLLLPTVVGNNTLAQTSSTELLSATIRICTCTYMYTCMCLLPRLLAPPSPAFLSGVSLALTLATRRSPRPLKTATAAHTCPGSLWSTHMSWSHGLHRRQRNVLRHNSNHARDPCRISFVWNQRWWHVHRLMILSRRKLLWLLW